MVYIKQRWSASFQSIPPSLIIEESYLQTFLHTLESPDICVDYEDHFEELQCLSFTIKREVLPPEDFAVLAIQVCRKYGKEVELHYQEKGYM